MLSQGKGVPLDTDPMELFEHIDDAQGFTGCGKATYANGDKYCGEMVKGVKQGQGTFFNVNGEIYTGQWQDDHYHGHGRHSAADGVYDGSYVRGKWQGPGTFRFTNGDVYSGAFHDDIFHGVGTKTKKNGQQLSGWWEHGEFCTMLEVPANMIPTFTGICRTVDSDGHVFFGTFQDGVREGYGRMEYRNGDVYDGTWHKGLYEGIGSHSTELGHFVGNFVGGLRCGKGAFTWSHGGLYTGEFRNNYREGMGVQESKEKWNGQPMLPADGYIAPGRWQADRKWRRPDLVSML
jgi:hypothetical protein